MTAMKLPCSSLMRAMESSHHTEYRFNSTEKELLDELNMERSVFYDRKKEAIYLFSICLFGYVIPELKDGVPRLYPD